MSYISIWVIFGYIQVIFGQLYELLLSYDLYLSCILWFKGKFAPTLRLQTEPGHNQESNTQEEEKKTQDEQENLWPRSPHGASLTPGQNITIPSNPSINITDNITT